MRKGTLTFLVVLVLSSVTFAHRLNEYLQATTISLSSNKVSLQIRLTPGTDVAPQILQHIDGNGDGLISYAEEQAYLKQVAHDVFLKIDGRSVELKAMGYSFPSVGNLSKGIGDVIIDYSASLETQRDAHQLVLQNHHYSSMAVYLVNCLLPADTGIRVTTQIRNADQSTYQLDFITGKLTGANSHSLVDADHRATVKTYFVHGVKHILGGYDHLLFLCALVLAAASLWDLIKIVTAFTVAHSITLTLATFGLAHLPEQIVEPVIAASIVFIAAQNIFWPKQANGNSRLAVAFFFGLFHGLGFAGGLMELMHAMPTTLILFAILGFSLGVEAGNQVVLLPLYIVLKCLKSGYAESGKLNSLLVLQRYASGGIGLAGLYYFWFSLFT